MNKQSIIQQYFEGKIHESAFLDSDQIQFTDAVREACKANYCGRYNTCWTCPPAVGDLRELEAHYKRYPRAFVYTTKHDVEDSFDIEGMFEARVVHDAIDKEAADMIDSIGGELLIPGGCNICEKCSYPDSPCRFPHKAKKSVEACGIDVVQLAATCGIHYYNGVNTVTYFSVIFFEE